MNAPRPSLATVVFALACACLNPLLDAQAKPTEDLNVMAWNIWHGGREDGKEVGPQRVIEVIKKSGADLVAMQETYGSGERISKGLGFHFHPRGTNVSIHSRFEILEDISVYKEFQCVGALVQLPNNTKLAFYSIWLPYSAEIWAKGTRDTSKPETMLAACKASHDSLTAMRKLIKERLSDAKYADVPIVIAGDFNSMSHLDYGAVGWDQYEATVDWPTGHVLIDDGFVDSYRACHPRIDRKVDSTWTPRFPEQQQDRIDFVFCRDSRTHGVAVAPLASRVIREHPQKFPSDHAAVISKLRVTKQSAAAVKAPQPIRAVSYNIKHGHGMDGRVDLPRVAAVLKKLEPDFVGLQEVDLRCNRSGKTNQANDLAEMLKMHPGFGKFMSYQGGNYGMAILSRYPLRNVTSLRLPGGNEPRVALIADAQLPNGRSVLLVNVHFDWVRDDSYRFGQAQKLADYLGKQDKPFILLGDFNDVPGSRTIELFDKIAHRTKKPAEDHFTIPSDKPSREIDFIYCAPAAAWKVGRVEVITEPVASDHRPVVAELVLEK